MSLLSHPSLIDADIGSALPHSTRSEPRESLSAVRQHDGLACFYGNILYRPGAGQATVALDLGDDDYAGASGLELQVKGDGRRYVLCIQTVAPRQRRMYRLEFRPVSGYWQRVRLPFSHFRDVSPLVGDASVPLDPARLHRQALLMVDRQPGRFQLEIERVGPFDRASPRETGHISRHLVAS